MGFRVEQELKQELESNPAFETLSQPRVHVLTKQIAPVRCTVVHTAVDSEELPPNRSHGNWVNEIAEEAAGFAEDLLDANAASPYSIRKQLDQVSCSDISK